MRVAVIATWTFGACWGWLFLFYAALQLLLYCQLRYRWESLSQWTPLWATTSLVFGGMFLVGAAMLLLAAAGRLPGTSARIQPLRSKRSCPRKATSKLTSSPASFSYSDSCF